MGLEESVYIFLMLLLPCHLQKGQIEKIQDRSRGKLIVAAIDFGTTFSGWAFQFIHDYERDPLKITAKNWNNGMNISTKAPTTVLIQPDGKTLDAFGYPAEDKYADLVREGSQKDWFYFSQFKMMLHENMKLKRTLSLEAVNGTELPAIDVFSSVIKYLKDDLVKESRTKIVGKIEDDDYLWVLTVPAIWNDAAKQFMREAAIKAGIRSDDLILALEPEAASVFCKLDARQHKGGTQINSFGTGMRYIVLDAGGGTVDITAHEILDDGNIRELHPPTGGYWGGTTVDKKFEEMLIDIFGAIFLQNFKEDAPDDYIELCRVFEVKKRSFSDTRQTQFDLPYQLMEMYKTQTGKTVSDAVQASKYARNKSVSIAKGNKLNISPEMMKSFYDNTLEKISNQIGTLLQDEYINPCKMVLMVGGFSESPIMRETLEKKFINTTFVNPADASIVVLKGAVLYGRQQSVIKQRICRYTYGHQMRLKFEEGDPEEYMVLEGDTKMCRHRFCRIIEKGEIQVTDDMRFARNPIMPSMGGKSMSLGIYKTNHSSPKYINESGCKKIGTLYIDGEHYNKQEYSVGGQFGGTEVQLLVKHVDSGEIFSATFDNL